MEITIDKDELMKAVSRVQSIIEKRSNMPILSMILLTAQEASIQISATDLEISLQQRIPAEVTQPGNVTISGRKLFEILKESKHARYSHQRKREQLGFHLRRYEQNTILRPFRRRNIRSLWSRKMFLWLNLTGSFFEK